MSRLLNLKPVINANNNQINISLAKSKLPKKMLKEYKDIKSIKLRLEGWSCG